MKLLFEQPGNVSTGPNMLLERKVTHFLSLELIFFIENVSVLTHMY